MRQSSVQRPCYASVSTTGQDLAAQLSTLDLAGVESIRIFTDALSGSARTERPGLTAMLDYARAGDTVVVTAIDNPSVLDMIKAIQPMLGPLQEKLDKLHTRTWRMTLRRFVNH